MKQGLIWRIVKRLVILAASIFALSAVVFALSRLAPGDPLVAYYGDRVEKMSAVERAQIEQRLGLNDSLTTQYFRWLERAIKGDFGISYKYKQDVWKVIAGRAGNTLLLGGAGFAATMVLALLLGVLCAWFDERWPDRILCKIGVLTSCIPEFWTSLALILLFSVMWRLLPSSGAYSVGGEGDAVDRLKHLILPMSVLVLSHLWYYASMVRNRLLEEVRAAYALTARAKGLSRRATLFRHCLRNALPSYISLSVVSVPHILGGTYIVETVFSYPGLGTLSYESARYHDYNMLMVLCLLTGAMVMIANEIGQAISGRIDPRMRSEESEARE